MSTEIPGITIGHVDVGGGLPCHLIAEIGLNHNGSLDLARQMIEQAAMSGATMVKFQKRCPEQLATAEMLDAPFPKCPLFGRTQREVRERLELTADQLAELKAYAEGFGLLFFMSVFDLDSLGVAMEIDVPALKIASHSMTNGPLLEAAAATGRPIMASLGGVGWEEADKAVEILRAAPLALFHCVSAYPTPDSLVKLDTIQAIRERYGLTVGFSGHEAGITLSMAAATLGAAMIERHFTLDRAMVGLDHGISLEPHEFSELALGLRRIAAARGIAEVIDSAEGPARTNYHVAVRAARPIKAGDTISRDDLHCKQPLEDWEKNFTGLEIDQVVGKKARRDFAYDDAVARADIE